jgi:hypothetical protein
VQIPGAFYAGLPPRGPIALPGNYTVRLTYGGQSQTASLMVAPDPRDTGSIAGLEQKFALSMEVYRDQDALHRAVNDIRSVEGEVAAALEKASGKPHGATLTAEGNALLKEVSKIEQVLIQVNIKGSEANLNFPGMLNEQIYSFSGLLDDADTAPTAQEIDTYAGLHASLDAQLAAWNALKTRQFSLFCARAQDNGARDPSSSGCSQRGAR